MFLQTSSIQKLTKNKELCGDLKNDNNSVRESKYAEDDEIDEEDQIENEFECGKPIPSVCNGFTTALELERMKKSSTLSKEHELSLKRTSGHVESVAGTSKPILCNGFKTALEMSKINQDNANKSKKKSDSRSITEFFKSDFNQIKSTDIKDCDKYRKDNNEDSKSRNDSLMSNNFNETCNSNFDNKLNKNELETVDISLMNAKSKGPDSNKVKGVQTTEEEKLNRVSTFKSKTSKRKLAVKNSLLFGDDLSPEIDLDDDIIEILDHASPYSTKNIIKMSYNNKVEVIESGQQNLQTKRFHTRNKTIQEVNKRSRSDINEPESSDKTTQDVKRQRLNNEVPENKTPASIKLHRKTFYILKPIVQEYYISTYIPDAAKFKTIFRKIHMDVLDRKILGKLFIAHSFYNI